MDSPNIILIIIDSLRKDYAKPLEEELSKFGFISYENVISPSPWTVPSNASIFTGLYPLYHGAHETKHKKGQKVRLEKNMDVLSLNLIDHNYNTYLISSNPHIRPSHGYIGFQHFYEEFSIPSFRLLSVKERETLHKILSGDILDSKFDIAKILVKNKFFMLLIKSSIEYILKKGFERIYITIGSRIKNWSIDKGANNILEYIKNKNLLNTTKKDPKFIFINFMETHEPYFIGKCETLDCLSNFKNEVLEKLLTENCLYKLRTSYINGIKYVTQKIIELLQLLKYYREFDNSLIIITSDHGQLLGEHGKIGHGTFLYDELLRVPLFIKYPEKMNIKLSQNNTGYISLTKLKPFIINLVNNNLSDDGILYSDTVFAESYGIHCSKIKSSEEKIRLKAEQFEKYRIAIYYKNFKGIFNVEDWKFEEVISYDPSIEITEDVLNQMRRKIIKFLNVATAAKSVEA
jgi:membrane-anchored protein YejM (alkaline phosphatase superfamily)